MRQHKAITLLLAIAALTTLTGCENNKTTRNTATGAAAGAIIGGVIGHQPGHAAEGAAVGAAAGGAGGYGYSKMNEDEEE